MITEKERREKVIADILEERQPRTPQAYAITFAFLSATEGVTQKEYAEALGISDRTVRKYISQHKQDYEEEYRRAEGELKQALGRSKKQREMTGSELDAFLDILIQKGTDPEGSTQDRKLLIEFTGLSGKELINRQVHKGSTLHWFILNNLSAISGYMNTRELGIHIQESGIVCREDSDDGENLQRFLDKSIFTDPSFFREMAYWGLAFMSMYNQESHPDLELMGDAIRLERLLNDPDLDTEDPLWPVRGVRGAKKYAEGKDYYKPTPGQGRDLDSMLREVFDVSPNAPKSELDRVMREFREKHPASPKSERVQPLKREDVVKRVTDKADLLKLYLSPDEWLHALNNPGKKKKY